MDDMRHESHWGEGRSERTIPETEDRATDSFDDQVRQLEKRWRSERYRGIERPYSTAEVVRLRGSVREDHT
ncbi:MAG: hypothetical protein ACOCVZ_09265, partial [Gemmatimonadota bacterium]